MSRIAVVLAEDYEDSELSVPRERLEEAGHELVVIGKEAGKELKGKQGEDATEVELAAGDADPGDYDALLVPGGYAPDKLRTDEDVVAFTRAMVESGKPAAVICHGPQLLIEAGVVEGRTMTSWPSVRTDLENAGATWKDAEVVTDGNLITSRNPDDLDAFCDAFLTALQGATARV